jgi:hypothetical protein
VGAKASGELQRLGAGTGRQAPLDPQLVTEQNSEAPLHHVVVVDDKDTKPALREP